MNNTVKAWQINKKLRISEFVASKLKNLGLKLPMRRVKVTIVSKQRLYAEAKANGGLLQGLTVTEYTFFGKFHQVYILEDLPIYTYMETLAHEFAHVWLNDTDSVLNSKDIAEIEGFCNLVAFRLFDGDRTRTARNQREMMLSNPDPIYGRGFRIMKERSERMGWTAFIKQF